MWIDLYDEMPTASPSQALHRRRHLRFFGLRVAWSEYVRPVRPTSGAPIGIMSSTWIYTKRRAYGRGRVRDWATLQNLEIKIGPYPPVATEFGAFELQPALVLPQNLEIRIHNRNTVDASGILNIYEQNDFGTEMSFLASPFAVIANTQKLQTYLLNRPRIATRVRYHTEASVGWRIVRIFGRPEWLTQ